MGNKDQHKGLENTTVVNRRKRQLKRNRALAVLGCVVVLMTAFALMVPAISITKDVAEQTEGIDLQTAPGADDLESVESPAPEADAPAPEQPAPEADAPEADAPEQPAASEPSDNSGDQGSASSDAADSGDSSSAAASDEKSDSSAAADKDDSKDSADKDDSKDSADKDEADRPAQEFKGEVLDGEGNVVMTVIVKAPKGAFPAGTEMKIEALDADSVADKVEAAIQDDPAIDGTVKSMTAIDIRFIDKKGKEIEPAKNVEVRITSGTVAEIESPVLVHVVDKSKDSAKGKTADAEVVKKVDVVDEQATDDTLKFKTNEFSPYVIVEMENLTTQVITAAGETYNVTVSYAPEANIPEGAELVVTEIVEGDDAYAGYLDQVNGELGSEVGFARFFDITIVADGEPIQPGAPVSVNIELADASELSNDVQAVHFADDGAVEVLDASLQGETVSFAAESFSVYAIVDDGGIPQPPRVTFEFEDPNNPDFYFIDKAGNERTTQIIKDGEVLQDVGLPTIPEGEKFNGWFIYNGNTAVEAVNFESGIAVSYGEAGSGSTFNSAAVTIDPNDLDEDGTYHVKVKAYFGEVVYLVFYEDAAGTNILNRIQIPKDSEYDISTQTVAAPESELAFGGWASTAGTNDDDRTAISPTTLTNIEENQEFFPIFNSGHWITFYAGATGSGATYTAPAFVIANGTATSAQPSNPEWKGYAFRYWTTEKIYTGENGAYVQPSSAPARFNFDSTLDADTTLYAYWTPANTTYTVVFWQQNVTDSKNATDAEKTYRFARQETENGTSGSTVQAANYSNLPNTDSDFTGFKLNTSKSDTSITVKADGTSIINVYFDRQLITMNFNRDITTYNETTGTTGTQYGYVNGQYVQIRWNGTNWVYTTTEPRYVDYTGTRYNTTTSNDGTQYGVYNGQVVRVYHHVGGTGWGAYDHWSRRETHSNNNDQRYNETRYVVSADGSYGFVNGSMVELNADGQYQNGTQNVEHIYEGTRYTQGTTRSFTGLYGQTLAQNGYKWPGTYGWQYQGTSGTFNMSYLGEFVLPANRITGANNTVTTINFTNTNATRTVYYYLQNADGSWPSEYIDSGITAAGTLQLAQKFQGFTVDAYQTGNNGAGSNTGTWTPGIAGSTEITGNNINGLGIRYRRLAYTLKYLDSVDNTELNGITSQNVAYGASLSSYEPASSFTPVSQYPGKVWDGKWYKDQACSEEFDWSDTMPNADMNVYAGWENVYYKVDIDPNGGVLTSSESTLTWLTYGQTVQRYDDVTRDYVEDSEGSYKYESWLRKVYLDAGYDPWDYSGYSRSAQYVSSDASNSSSMVPYSGTGSEVTVEYPYDSTRYRYEKGAYALIGWYEITFAEGHYGDLAYKTGESLYTFGTGITHDTYIQAQWRRVGEYHVDYKTDVYLMNEDGSVNTTDSGIDTTNVPPDSFSYADHSQSSIMRAPDSPITVGEGDNAKSYVFQGWWYNGQLYTPGDTFTVLADLAEDKVIGQDPETGEDIIQKTVYIHPVYQEVDNLPVDTTHIYWYSNWKDSDKHQISDLTQDTQFKDESDDELQPNQAVDIREVTSLPSFDDSKYTGYTFKGWARVPVEGPGAVDVTSDDFNAANYMYLYWDGAKFHVDSETGTVVTEVAADEDQPYHDMYAVWEINTYTVTVTKTVTSSIEDDQHTGFVFTPTFTGYPGGSNFALAGQQTTVTDPETGDTYTIETSKTFENVPYGATVKMTETPGDGFEVSATSQWTTDASGAPVSEDPVEYANGEGVITIAGDVTIAYTNARHMYKVKFQKTDLDGTVIGDAQFNLLRKDKNGEYARYTSATGDGFDHGVLTIGSTTLDGLIVGDYKLVETSAPDGYIFEATETTFTVGAGGLIDANSLAGSSITVDGESVPLYALGEPTGDDGFYTVIIKNQPGQPLPHTGGPGTAALTVIGIAMIAVAAIMLITRRRPAAARSGAQGRPSLKRGGR